MIYFKIFTSFMLCSTLAIFAAGCSKSGEESTSSTQSEDMSVAAPDVVTVTIEPGPEVQMELQEALIDVDPGTVIQLEEGTYTFALGLSLDVDNVTLRGRGMDNTVLDFKNQEAGSEGLHITSNGVLLEDFAVIDTKGNAIKSHSADDIVYRRIRTEWTDGPKETNGAYGLYPVSSTNVLVEECVAIGASDAGIYVGQSENVLVLNCRAEYNVAGIEIENCHGAEVRGCEATNNTGGILVFDLPDLPVQRGHNVRLIQNKTYKNNTLNFAPKGNIVASVPTGTGIMIMANGNVEILENDIHGNDTVNIMVVSYLSNGIEIKDPNYYPYPEDVHIHHNAFGPGGTAPAGTGGNLMAAAAGKPLPDIVWDGLVNPENKGRQMIFIHDNTKSEGEVTFADMMRIVTNPKADGVHPARDLSNYGGSLDPVPSIIIENTK